MKLDCGILLRGVWAKLTPNVISFELFEHPHSRYYYEEEIPHVSEYLWNPLQCFPKLQECKWPANSNIMSVVSYEAILDLYHVSNNLYQDMKELKISFENVPLAILLCPFSKLFLYHQDYIIRKRWNEWQEFCEMCTINITYILKEMFATSTIKLLLDQKHSDNTTDVVSLFDDKLKIQHILDDLQGSMLRITEYLETQQKDPSVSTYWALLGHFVEEQNKDTRRHRFDLPLATAYGSVSQSMIPSRGY